MPRLVVLSSIAGLSLFVACVDVGQPAQVTRCASTHCSDGQGGSGGGGGSRGGTTGTGGIGGQGGAAGSGGVVGGGGETAGSTGGTTGGAGGTAGAGGGEAGTGGGTAGAGDGGSSGLPDAGVDVPTPGPETGSPSDTKPPVPDAPAANDTATVGPEAGKPEPAPEPGPDAALDTPQDLAVDLTPDLSPPRPEAGLDAGNCIQRFQAGGYSLGTDAAIAACSGCRAGSNSKEPQCKAMIDCLQPLWASCARGSGCWLNCQNTTGSDSVVESCVATLTSAACGTH